VTHVEELNVEDLVRILIEPKNALSRQYQKMFELDGVKLHFASGVLRAIAEKAIERKTGARGLRNVMEKMMLNIMYELPSLHGVRECVINEDVLEGDAPPLYIYDADARIAS
jgi:ATP-dependent Clp protease ATP-binding subunit ClpX